MTAKFDIPTSSNSIKSFFGPPEDFRLTIAIPLDGFTLALFMHFSGYLQQCMLLQTRGRFTWVVLMLSFEGLPVVPSYFSSSPHASDLLLLHNIRKARLHLFMLSDSFLDLHEVLL